MSKGKFVNIVEINEDEFMNSERDTPLSPARLTFIQEESSMLISSSNSKEIKVNSVRHLFVIMFAYTSHSNATTTQIKKHGVVGFSPDFLALCHCLIVYQHNPNIPTILPTNFKKEVTKSF